MAIKQNINIEKTTDIKVYDFDFDFGDGKGEKYLAFEQFDIKKGKLATAFGLAQVVQNGRIEFTDKIKSFKAFDETVNLPAQKENIWIGTEIFPDDPDLNNYSDSVRRQIGLGTRFIKTTDNSLFFVNKEDAVINPEI